MAPDPASILRVAETERDLARQAYDHHLATCTNADCPSRDALERHLNRTEFQVQLLTPAMADDEGLF